MPLQTEILREVWADRWVLGGRMRPAGWAMGWAPPRVPISYFQFNCNLKSCFDRGFFMPGVVGEMVFVGLKRG